MNVLPWVIVAALVGGIIKAFREVWQGFMKGL